MRIRQKLQHAKWPVRQHFTRLYNSQQISSINTNKNHINSDPGWRSQVAMAQATYGSRSNKDGRYIRHGGYCISDVTDYRLLIRLRHFSVTPFLPYRHCEKVDKGRWSIWNVGTSVPIRGRLSKKPMNFVATASNMYRLACLICNGLTSVANLTQNVRLRQPFTEFHVARLSWHWSAPQFEPILK